MHVPFFMFFLALVLHLFLWHNLCCCDLIFFSEILSTLGKGQSPRRFLHSAKCCTPPSCAECFPFRSSTAWSRRMTTQSLSSDVFSVSTWLVRSRIHCSDIIWYTLGCKTPPSTSGKWRLGSEIPGGLKMEAVILVVSSQHGEGGHPKIHLSSHSSTGPNNGRNAGGMWLVNMARWY